MGCPRASRRRSCLRAAAYATVLGTAVLATSAPAAAQDRREPPAEAVVHYQEALEHYRAGRYREAIARLERARALDPESPTLRYNLARVYELVGELDAAIEHYAAYVAQLPPGEERERTVATLRRLEGARDARAAQPEPPPWVPPPLPPAERAEDPRYVTTRGVADVWFWVALGGGAAFIATGAGVGAVALDRHSAAESFVLGADGVVADREELEDSATSLALVADVLFALGGVSLLSAGLLYALRTETQEVLPESAVRASVAIDGRSASLVLRGSM